jgi:hypothetical protein
MRTAHLGDFTLSETNQRRQVGAGSGISSTCRRDSAATEVILIRVSSRSRWMTCFMQLRTSTTVLDSCSLPFFVQQHVSELALNQFFSFRYLRAGHG